jgi:hypothetical protein
MVNKIATEYNNFSQSIPSFIFSYSVAVLLILYIPDDEFLI